jgi:hypothetical protein
MEFEKPQGVDYSKEQVFEKMKAGYIPAIFKPITYFEQKEGHWLVFQITKKLPTQVMQSLMKNFGETLRAQGMKAMYIPHDMDFLGVIQPTEKVLNAADRAE